MIQRYKEKKRPNGQLSVYGRVSLGIKQGRHVARSYEEFFEERNSLNQD